MSSTFARGAFVRVVLGDGAVRYGQVRQDRQALVVVDVMEPEGYSITRYLRRANVSLVDEAEIERLRPQLVEFVSAARRLMRQRRAGRARLQPLRRAPKRLD